MGNSESGLDTTKNILTVYDMGGLDGPNLNMPNGLNLPSKNADIQLDFDRTKYKYIRVGYYVYPDNGFCLPSQVIEFSNWVSISLSDITTINHLTADPVYNEEAAGICLCAMQSVLKTNNKFGFTQRAALEIDRSSKITDFQNYCAPFRVAKVMVAQTLDSGVIVGTGEVKGENGKSAYDIAVENGFIGTEEDWLESLKNTHEIEVLKKTIEEMRIELNGLKNWESADLENQDCKDHGCKEHTFKAFQKHHCCGKTIIVC